MTLLILTFTDTFYFIDTSNKMPFEDNISVSYLFDEYYRNMSTESYSKSNTNLTMASTQSPIFPNEERKENNVSNHMSDMDTKIESINNATGKLAKHPPYNITLPQVKKLAHIKVSKNDTHANSCLDFIEQQQEWESNYTDCLTAVCCSGLLVDNSVDGDILNSRTHSDKIVKSKPNFVRHSADTTLFSTEHSDASDVQRTTYYHDNTSNSMKNTIIHIGGLFELSGSRSDRLGLSELTSAKLAVEHVNRANFLHGYTLDLLHNDTGVSIQHYQLLYLEYRGFVCTNNFLYIFFSVCKIMRFERNSQNY